MKTMIMLVVLGVLSGCREVPPMDVRVPSMALSDAEQCRILRYHAAEGIRSRLLRYSPEDRDAEAMRIGRVVLPFLRDLYSESSISISDVQLCRIYGPPLPVWFFGLGMSEAEDLEYAVFLFRHYSSSRVRPILGHGKNNGLSNYQLLQSFGWGIIDACTPPFNPTFDPTERDPS